MSEHTLKIITLSLACVLYVLLMCNLIYDIIKSRKFYKRMEEQHEAFMKSIEQGHEQR